MYSKGAIWQITHPTITGNAWTVEERHVEKIKASKEAGTIIKARNTITTTSIDTFADVRAC
jgi:hypothetical protein